MNVFFDTEFTGLYKDTTLISIGLVSEDNQKFYAEFTDYDRVAANNNIFVRDNVLSKLYSENKNENYIPYYILGSRITIREMLTNWFKQFGSVQLISDVCHFDFVLLIDLFGSAFSLPENVSPYCYDINQDVAKYYGISCKEAFDKSREQIVSEICPQMISENKHNSLYDAEVIKLIYENLQKRLS